MYSNVHLNISTLSVELTRVHYRAGIINMFFPVNICISAYLRQKKDICTIQNKGIKRARCCVVSSAGGECMCLTISKRGYIFLILVLPSEMGGGIVVYILPHR